MRIETSPIAATTTPAPGNSRPYALKMSDLDFM
jgi:hypothetical protein